MILDIISCAISHRYVFFDEMFTQTVAWFKKCEHVLTEQFCSMLFILKSILENSHACAQWGLSEVIHIALFVKKTKTVETN